MRKSIILYSTNFSIIISPSLFTYALISLLETSNVFNLSPKQKSVLLYAIFAVIIPPCNTSNLVVTPEGLPAIPSLIFPLADITPPLATESSRKRIIKILL